MKIEIEASEKVLRHLAWIISAEADFLDGRADKEFVNAFASLAGKILEDISEDDLDKL